MRRFPILAPWLLAPALAAPAAAQSGPPPQPEIWGIGIDQRLGERLPMDLVFRDDRGREVRTGDLFDGERPVLLTFNFSDCPLLCSVQLTALVESLREIDYTIGDQFRVVTVSLDPEEGFARARQTKERYLGLYGREGADAGWTFLVGDEDQIEAATSATGFHFRWIDDETKYAHKAAVIFLTPEGRIARYVENLAPDPTTLRFSILETRDGDIATFKDLIFQSCFSFQGEGYALYADNFVKLGGLVTVLLLGWFFWRMRRYEHARAELRRVAEVSR